VTKQSKNQVKIQRLLRYARNDSCGEEGLFSLKQLFPIDTKNSCSELFQDNRKCQVKADIIIKRREVTQEIKLNRALRNGGCWLSIGLAVGHEMAYLLLKIKWPTILLTLVAFELFQKRKEVTHQRR